MADGADRILSYLSGVEVKTSRLSGGVHMTGGGGDETSASGSVEGVWGGIEFAIHIDFRVDGDGCINLNVTSHYPASIQPEDLYPFITAVWEGAASKGFPHPGWDHG